MEKLNPKIAKRKAVKDGLGNNVKDYFYNPAENIFQHKDELVHESPLCLERRRFTSPLIAGSTRNVTNQDTSSGMTETTN